MKFPERAYQKRALIQSDFLLFVICALFKYFIFGILLEIVKTQEGESTAFSLGLLSCNPSPF
ncbi:hypothetical protein CSE_00580 [Caldisericum exile AZM16c01]|uniref:Uncharacterized protein n=1 Tax=Caldisericum exile (strain DSM 21853 / NBRC 104410 / AZM16c01) TaxID=511051 RepID=A0A7U6GD51_CALEA|nr:hypothetical protein CSE_00580 [Caldisericum exile AZM16c01]